MCALLLFGPLALFALELWLLITVGGRIGGLETVTLVFLTAAVGLYAARGQGLAALERFQRGGIPGHAEVLDGPLLVVAALCLVVPGFITDAVGALLLIPPVRRLVARYLTRRFGGRGGPGGSTSGEDGETIIVVRRVE